MVTVMVTVTVTVMVAVTVTVMVTVTVTVMVAVTVTVMVTVTVTVTVTVMVAVTVMVTVMVTVTITVPRMKIMTTLDPRLWQLVSPTLPVGGYAYSQGLETAVAAGWVVDEATCMTWVDGLAQHVMPRVDLPLLHRMHDAQRRRDTAAALSWNRELLAMRESAELRFEDQTMGRALARLARELGCAMPVDDGDDAPSYAAAFAWLASRWDINAEAAVAGYLWSWCENQIAAAVKLIPLGQTAGQLLLRELGDALPARAAAAMRCADADLGMTAPGLGIASALHETQHTRLFRS